MRNSAGSKMAKAQSWANKSEMLIGGFGPGPGATLPQDRGRDVARYEQMKATLPKKPPKPAETARE